MRYRCVYVCMYVCMLCIHMHALGLGKGVECFSETMRKEFLHALQVCVCMYVCYAYICMLLGSEEA